MNFGGLAGIHLVEVTRLTVLNNWDVETLCKEYIWDDVVRRLPYRPKGLWGIVPPTMHDMWKWIDSVRSMQLPQPYCKRFHYEGCHIVFQTDYPEASVFIHRNGLVIKRLGDVQYPIGHPTPQNKSVYEDLRKDYNQIYIRKVKRILSRVLPTDLARAIAAYLLA